MPNIYRTRSHTASPLGNVRNNHLSDHYAETGFEFGQEFGLAVHSVRHTL